jgi:thiol-disulfide isomerase/thioredoxin
MAEPAPASTTEPTGGQPKRKRMATIAALVVAGVAVGWLAWSLFTPVPGYERALPDLDLERLEGGQLQLTSLVGGPVVINLWATWCLPCLRELPMMANMARRDPGVKFVFADQGEQRATVESYLAEHPEMGLQGVVLDRDQALSVEFQTHGLPMTLFFDDRGNHVHSHIGELTEVELFNYVIDLKAGNLNPL